MNFKMKTSILLVVLICNLLLSGCARYYYTPNMANVPLFQEKRETRLNVAASGGVESSAFELQGAHSFTNHVAGMFNFAAGGADDYYGGGTNSTYAEAGAGYYYPFAKHFVAEAYGGMGIGGVKNEFTGAASYSKVTYLKPWIQPSIGVRFSFFELALSSRIGMLNFTSVKSSGVPSDYQYELNIVKDFRTTFLFEPALTFRLGWKYVLLQIQVLESVNTVLEFPQEIINENIGLIFTIPPPKSNSEKIKSF